MKQIVIFIICSIYSMLAFADCTNLNSEVTVLKPNSIYVDHGDGTITDKETGLMWKKCTLGLSGNDCLTGSVVLHTWQAAIAAANENSDNGYSDWRLPNVKELFSLVEVACSNPSINELFFPNTSNNNYWSSTLSQAIVSQESRYVDFFSGASLGYLKNATFSVRLVRDSK